MTQFTQTVSSLHQRMIDDMTLRKLNLSLAISNFKLLLATEKVRDNDSSTDSR